MWKGIELRINKINLNQKNKIGEIMQDFKFTIELQ